MTILFGTARTRYPDFGSPDGGLSQLEDKTKEVLSKALQTIGARIFNSSFVEDGVQSVPGASFLDSQFQNLNKPSRRTIKSQRGELTILLKKRMFSSLRENYDLRFMDDDERVYIRAIKSLFRRKCEQIAFYESLTTVEAVIEDPSYLTLDSFLDVFLGAIGTVVDLGFGLDSSLEFILENDPAAKEYLETFSRLKQLNDRTKQRPFTTWITEPNAPDIAAVGEGVGVIEFTMATSVDTNVTLQTGGGNATIKIEDPYRLTRITESDIELALRSAMQEEQGFPAFFDARGEELMEEAMELDRELNELRRLSNKSPINFEFPFGTEEDVFALIVNINFPFNLQTINDVPAEEVLSAQELIRVTQIFRKMQEYKTIQDRAILGAIDNPFVLTEQQARKRIIRNKMRREFVGHHIFQQMDSVHIYLNSFTRDETPIYANRGDLITGQLLEKAFTFEEQRGRLSDEILEQERQHLAPAMTLIEYKAYRNPVNFRGSGNHIFAGLVKKVTSRYTSETGQFTLNVSVNDNMEYLKLSRINEVPGLTQPQGELEDPLTPFDIETDPSTGLVLDRKLSEQNRKRLPFLRFDQQPFMGEKLENDDRLFVDTASGDNNSVLTYRHLPGLVYKWKDGIIASTQEINMTQPLSGRVSVIENISDDFGLTVTTTPFSNLDAADILSILITGQPHNYNTFIQQAISAGNLTIDNDLNKRNYFNFLFDFLERQNSINGNFIPAKSSSIDPKITADVIRYQKQIARNNSVINELQRQLAQAQDRARSLPTSEKDPIVQRVQSDLSQEIAEIQAELQNVNNELDFSLDEQGDAAQIQIYGNSVQVQFEEQDHRKLRDRLKYILRRKPEEVRYNQDKNYFVVSERYDSDTDIQAFVLQLRDQSFDLFKSTFQYPADICNKVAGMIDFELFADSQGNIRFRPPEYNKVPLTLLMKMVELGHNDGISLAPDFLIRLLENRVGLAQQKAFSLELQIYEKFLLLGVYNLQGAFRVPGSAFQAASRGVNLALVEEGNSYSFDIVKAQEEANKDSIFVESNQTQAAFTKPDLNQQQTSDLVEKIINVRNQIKALGDGSKIEKTGSNLTVEGGSTRRQNAADNADIVQIRKDIQKYNSNAGNVSTNRLTLTNQIAQLITDRQNNLNLWARLAEDRNSVENSNEVLGRLRPTRLFVNELSKLSPFSNDEPLLPEFIQDLIEDDIRNDEGFNSGKRFIIEDDVILSQTFAIETPEYSRVDVQGTEDMVGPGIKQTNPLQFWAGATDFDSWRQFGYRAGTEVEAPFIRDPETQAAPYATFRLIRERRKIHSGTITVVGNEFYEAGDVVYVTNRQMLYYVESVQHSFRLEASQFETTLQLSYGHALGDYIPTPLDVIGKTIIANGRRAFGGLKVTRNINPSDTIVNLETVFFPWDARDNPLDGTLSRDELFSSFARNVGGKIINAAMKASTKINKENQDIARVEIRGYTLSGDVGLTSRVNMYAEFARRLMTEQRSPNIVTEISEGLSVATETVTGSGGSTSAEDGISTLRLPASKVSVPTPIALDADLSDDDVRFRRIPSTEAWSYSVDVSYQNNNTGLPINALDIVLVIDKSRRGDQTPEVAAGLHTADALNPNNPDLSPVSDVIGIV